jgi:DNA-binding phage protein
MYGRMIDERAIGERYGALRDQLDERGRRLHAAAEVRALGYGGLAAVARATGLSRGTIGRGLKDLAPRCPGAGCGATAVVGTL